MAGNRVARCAAVALAVLMWPAAAPAQVVVGAGSCSERVADLGINWSCESCSGSYDNELGSWQWSFRQEPRVDDVRTDGPAFGRIRRGDVLVAVDGALITTRSGSRRWSQMRPGQPMTVTVRRGNREREVELVPGSRCAPPVPPAPPAVGHVAPAASAVGVAPSAGVAVGSVPRPDLPSSPPAPPAPPTAAQQSRAWFGFGLSCRSCRLFPVRHKEIAEIEKRLSQTEAREARMAMVNRIEELREEGFQWEFSEEPRIYSVDPGGPADQAGLRRGDILTQIDGVGLTSEEGGLRLGQVEPGQEVEFLYRRGTTLATARVSAQARPGSEYAMAARAYRDVLDRMARSSGRVRVDTDATAEILEELRRGLSASRLSKQREQAFKELELDRQLELTQEAMRNARLGRALGYAAALPATELPLRYSGSMGKVNVVVRGHSSVTVTRDEATKEVVITTGDAVIRVKPEQDD